MSDVEQTPDSAGETHAATSTEPKFQLKNVLMLVVPAGIVLIAGYVFFGRMDGLTWLDQAMKPSRVPVTGQVFYQGKPLADVIVATRVVDADLKGSISWGDEDGRFSLKTDVQGTFEEGAYSGEHIVTIKVHARQGGLGAPPLLTPPEYAAFDTTPLRIQVEKDGKNHFEFTLEGEPETTQAEVDARGTIPMNMTPPPGNEDPEGDPDEPEAEPADPPEEATDESEPSSPGG